jgi:choline dehydrogenase-like flavoprotein
LFVAAEQTGVPINKDINSGDPIGLGMGTLNCFEGKRVTAATYLKGCGDNLSILAGSLVSRVMIEDKTAWGVATSDGGLYLARKEVIISGGALNSPQLLLLSGVGPREELEKHNIPLQHELPMVGRNLQDHCWSTVGVVLSGATDATDIGSNLCPSPMAFLKSPHAMKSPEFHRLPTHVQEHMQLPTVPNFEIAAVSDPRRSSKDLKLITRPPVYPGIISESSCRARDFIRGSNLHTRKSSEQW